jgi:N-acetylglucosamine kinase-like BadF-type ATPase
VTIYLGIDGGGTKTSCVVANEKTVLGSATSGGSNITRLGEARVRESLQVAVRDACASAGIDPQQVKSACVGLSGAGRPEVRDAVARMMAEIVGGKVLVVSDLETTLEAAVGGGPGVIVIGGTGSIAYGRDANGRTARAGGWGLAISDEGSGEWIGRAAVSSVLSAKDAGEDPPLLAEILKLWKVSTLDELVRHANASPTPDFASLFPSVLKAAEAAEASALKVLRAAGMALAGLVNNVIGRLFPDSRDVPVAMSGGVFRQSELVRKVFYNEVVAAHPEAVVQSEVVDPVEGALALARKPQK